MPKSPVQIMFSDRSREHLYAMPAGTRSEYVNSLVEKDIDRQAKKAGKDHV